MAEKKSKTVPMLNCSGVHSSILNCSGIKKEDEFYTSWSRFDGDRMCYCKSCCDKIFKYYLSETKDEKTALYFTCSVLHMPFIKDVYDKIQDNLSLGKYISSLRMKKSQKEVLSDFDGTDVNINEIDVVIKSTEQKKKELEEFKIKWGVQETIEDYEFLERTYNRYMTNFEDDLNPQQADILCDLCRDRLLLRKLSENGCQENDMITKVQTRANNLMKTLKIDNFEVAQKRTLSEQSFIEKIKQMEETKPIELYTKENNDYVDYTKRKKYYTDLVLRPLCNTLAGHKDFNIDMSDLEQYNLKGDK